MPNRDISGCNYSNTVWVVDVPGLWLALKNFTNGHGPYHLVNMVSTHTRIDSKSLAHVFTIPRFCEMLGHMYVRVGGTQ